MIASIGQGYVTVTPLQLARAYAALANGGTLYSPRIGEELLSPDGKVAQKINPPVVGHLPVAKATLAYIRNALQGVVTRHGGGRVRRVPAGQGVRGGQDRYRPGTASWRPRCSPRSRPCDHPKYVVVMMIPDSGFGADVSAPAVRQIWAGIYGLDGHKAALPGGQLPAPPHINQAGQIVKPAGRPAGRRKGCQVSCRRRANGRSRLGRPAGILGRAGSLPSNDAAASGRQGVEAAASRLGAAGGGAGAEPARHAAGLVRDRSPH